MLSPLCRKHSKWAALHVLHSEGCCHVAAHLCCCLLFSPRKPTNATGTRAGCRKEEMGSGLQHLQDKNAGWKNETCGFWQRKKSAGLTLSVLLGSMEEVIKDRAQQQQPRHVTGGLQAGRHRWQMVKGTVLTCWSCTVVTTGS